MQKKGQQYINLYFSKDDKDILAWANMIKKNGLNLGTWIQGILVAEIVGADLNIGSISTHTLTTTVQKTSPFGDDTNNEKGSPATGWHIRGKNRELIAGSVLSIKVTRTIVQEVMDKTQKEKRYIGAYIKAIIRKKINQSPTETDHPPKNTDIRDLFALHDHKKTHNDPNPLKRDNQQPNSSHKSPKQNQNSTPKPLQQPEREQGRGEDQQPKPAQKNRNPLLNYIDKSGQP